jgi:hypothetical protein
MLEACHQGHLLDRRPARSPQVVSAPSTGVPAARLRIAMSASRRPQVPLNSSRPLHAFPHEGTILMSPLH